MDEVIEKTEVQINKLQDLKKAMMQTLLTQGIGHTKFDNPQIIAQLERWWDKYKVSLKDLDAQVEEAEKMMRGYLRELGYE